MRIRLQVDESPQILISDRISAAVNSMTSSEKRIARVFLARYPTVGLASVTEFAKKAEVSAPTVLRFVARLGFDGYPTFRSALRDEIEVSQNHRIKNPQIKVLATGSHYGNELQEVVRSTMAELDTALVERVVDLFSDDRRSIHVLGEDVTKSVAGHLLYYLRKMRRSVFEIPAAVQERVDRIIDLRKKDIVALFDTGHHRTDVVTTARICSQRGCTVVLFTDQLMSEASEVATHVFRAKVVTSSSWESLLGLNAIVESIALALDHRLSAVVRERAETVELYRREFHEQAMSTDRDR
ncbi:MurR/RpiR family transcriptional regulator [Aminobacter anthyllidis]|uniref:MurR/RpiR family transcriptional regulator n=1 Tax=Aminobacter anthyllidis TaxID=1035067 RepID=A0A9X1D7E5_9HYPH|nr:MurR/RpiR family transcriptional regulator [Aminobacter anthyllidis]MBT1159870.1 MurR/RpiR family transcriptional regulator [Aminobacter anthyllidis]